MSRCRRHPNCDGGPCKSLTREELEPSDADRALAAQLHDEGWIQVSAKYRHVRRWASPPPSGRSLVAPEHRDTAWGRRAAAAIERWVTSCGALHSEYTPYDVTLYPATGAPRRADRPFELAPEVVPNPLVEERTLTVSEFKAYKTEERRRHRVASEQREAAAHERARAGTR